MTASRKYLVWCLLILASGCGSHFSDAEKTSKVKNEVMSFSSVVTVGNRSYIPLNLRGNVAEHSQFILEVLQKFEEDRRVTITDWKTCDQQSAHTTSPFVYGLWVDHKPN